MLLVLNYVGLKIQFCSKQFSVSQFKPQNPIRIIGRNAAKQKISEGTKSIKRYFMWRLCHLKESFNIIPKNQSRGHSGGYGDLCIRGANVKLSGRRQNDRLKLQVRTK